MLCTIAVSAQQNETYNPKKSAATWFIIGGSTMFVAAGTRLAGDYIDPPSIDQYSNVTDFNREYKKWEKNQKTFNGIFYGGMMASGICIVFGSAELFNIKETKVGEKAVLRYQINPAGATVALNF